MDSTVQMIFMFPHLVPTYLYLLRFITGHSLLKFHGSITYRHLSQTYSILSFHIGKQSSNNSQRPLHLFLVTPHSQGNSCPHFYQANTNFAIFCTLHNRAILSFVWSFLFNIGE
jgi:hypothetical protein